VIREPGPLLHTGPDRGGDEAYKVGKADNGLGPGEGHEGVLDDHRVCPAAQAHDPQVYALYPDGLSDAQAVLPREDPVEDDLAVIRGCPSRRQGRRAPMGSSGRYPVRKRV
jgi:hypothetical protein